MLTKKMIFNNKFIIRYIYGLGSNVVLEEVPKKSGGGPLNGTYVEEGYEEDTPFVIEENEAGGVESRGGPAVDIRARPTSGDAPLTVEFLVRTSDIIALDYDFGDGNIQSSPLTSEYVIDTILDELQRSPGFTKSYRGSHIYEDSGNYVATVIVENEDGLTNTDSVEIDVT